MRKLPKWCITDTFPSLYDNESATAIEQTAKLYGAVNDMIDEYNAWVDKINNTIEEFINDTNADYETFKVALRQEFQDFIDVVDLKLRSQDSTIENAVNYMKTNLRSSVRELIAGLRVTGELNDDIVACFEDFANQIKAESEARTEADNALREALENETQTRESDKIILQKAINDEATERENADSNLQKAIDDEATARETADSNLQKAIDDEATARENADNDLQKAIADEATARENADNALRDSFNTINSLHKPINVLSYGVDNTGDEEKAESNTTIINELLSQEKILYFPCGTYCIKEALKVKNNAGILGENRRKTIITCSENDNVIEVPLEFDPNNTHLPCWSVILQGFTIAGTYGKTIHGLHIYNYTYNHTCSKNDQAYAELKGDAYGLELRGSVIRDLHILCCENAIYCDVYTNLITIEHCFIETCYQAGINNHSYDSRFHNIDITYCMNGIYNTGGDCLFSHMKIYQNGRRSEGYVHDINDAWGVQFHNANRCQIINVQVQESLGNGVIFNNCKGTLLIMNVDANGFGTENNSCNIGVQFINGCSETMGILSCTDKNLEQYGKNSQRLGLWISEDCKSFSLQYSEYGNKEKLTDPNTLKHLYLEKKYTKITPTLFNISRSDPHPLYAIYDGNNLKLNCVFYITNVVNANEAIMNISALFANENFIEYPSVMYGIINKRSDGSIIPFIINDLGDIKPCMPLESGEEYFINQVFNVNIL